jgi:hypothetical protein
MTRATGQVLLARALSEVVRRGGVSAEGETPVLVAPATHSLVIIDRVPVTTTTIVIATVVTAGGNAGTPTSRQQNRQLKQDQTKAPRDAHAVHCSGILARVT